MALTSPEPIISPAWSPDGRELAYVSFESQKAVVCVQDVASGKRRALANFRGSNSAPAWSPDGQHAGGDAVARRRLAALPDRPQRRQPAPPDEQPGDRHRAGVLARRPRPLLRQRPRRRPADLPHAAGGGAVERVTFAGSYNISPAISPDGRTLAYISRQGNAFRLHTLDLTGSGAAVTLTDTSDDESPSFAPNGRLIIYATRAQGRDVLMTTTLDGKIKARLVSTTADVREPVWGPFGR